MAQELKTINEWQFIGRLAVILYHKIDADPSLPEADVIIQMVNTCKTSVWLYCLVYFHWYGSCVDYTNNGGGLRRIFKRNNNELSLIILSMWKHSFEKQRQSFHILPIVSQLFSHLTKRNVLLLKGDHPFRKVIKKERFQTKHPGLDYAKEDKIEDHFSFRKVCHKNIKLWLAFDIFTPVADILKPPQS